MPGTVFRFRVAGLTLALSSVLLAEAHAQSRPNTGRTPSGSQTVHDKAWLKSQLRRRYGTSAIPEKTPPASGDKKQTTEPKSPPAKN